VPYRTIGMCDMTHSAGIGVADQCRISSLLLGSFAKETCDTCRSVQALARMLCHVEALDWLLQPVCSGSVARHSVPL